MIDERMIDVVIPSHLKDIDTLDLCIEGIRNNVQDVRRIIVVSKEKMTDNAEWVSEDKFPFSKEDVGEIVGNHRRTGWYYQQLLKMHAHEGIPDLLDDYLVVDSDTIFLTPKKYINEGKINFDVSDENGLYYYEHMGKLVSGLKKQTNYSGIVHHMLFSRDILDDLKGNVSDRFNVPFWKAFLNCVTEYFHTIMPQHQDIGTGTGRSAEYELYFNYCLQYYPDRIVIDPKKDILAYKSRLGVEGEQLLSGGSRTNLNGHHSRPPSRAIRRWAVLLRCHPWRSAHHRTALEGEQLLSGGSRTNLHGHHVQVIPIEEEKNLSFATFKDAIKYLSDRCKELGWDAVTFQQHSRIERRNYENIRV